MHTGRARKAADFAANLAEAAKKRHSERVETRTEAIPREMLDLISDLTTQVLNLRHEVTQIKGDLGQFYTRLGERAA